MTPAPDQIDIPEAEPVAEPKVVDIPLEVVAMPTPKIQSKPESPKAAEPTVVVSDCGLASD